MTIEHNSLPRLRKGLLQAIQTLIDGLRTDSAANLVLAQPALKLPLGVRATPLPMGPLPEPDPCQRYPLGQRWPEFRLNSICFPYMACVVEGEVDLRIGFPPALLARKGIVAGTNAPGQNSCCFLTLPASSFLLLPPGVAYFAAGRPPWERPDCEPPPLSTILWVHFPPGAALCRVGTMRGPEYTGHLPLQVKNEHLQHLWELLTSELDKSTHNSDDISKALLLTLLLYLRSGIADPASTVADGMSFWTPADQLPPPSSQLPTDSILKKACEYVQLNLHEPLSPARIANHAQLSPTQLKRIYRNGLDTTVMDYVTQRRIEAAKVYLRQHKLSITEISSLVGYPQAAHLSRVFHREVGMTPMEYRRRNREELSCI